MLEENKKNKQKHHESSRAKACDIYKSGRASSNLVKLALFPTG